MSNSPAHELSPSAPELIDWALENSQRPILTTKFGPESAVLLHLVSRRRADIPVIWVDTGYNTRQSLQFADRLTRQLGLNLHVYRPQGAQWQAIPTLDDPGHPEFTRRIKLEPFQRGLQAHRPDLWLTALRREQTAHRAAQPPVVDSGRGYLKVAPLLDWTRVDMDAYLVHHDLPRGPECYDPTKGETRRECGLHLVY